MENTTERKKFYDGIWEEWDDMEQYAPTPRHLRNLILSFMKECVDISSICDIGCGNGFVLRTIAKLNKGYTLTGTELSETALQKAKKHIPNGTFVELDVGKETLSREFDLVICSQVLEHIEDDISALRNICAMTNKYFILTVPAGRFDSTSRLMGHYRHYSMKELRDKFEATGFEIMKEKRWGFPFHSLYKYVLNLLPKESKKRIGFGRYGICKKTFCDILYWLFFFNIFPAGNDIIMLARKCIK